MAHLLSGNNIDICLQWISCESKHLWKRSIKICTMWVMIKHWGQLFYTFHVHAKCQKLELNYRLSSHGHHELLERIYWYTVCTAYASSLQTCDLFCSSTEWVSPRAASTNQINLIIINNNNKVWVGARVEEFTLDGTLVHRRHQVYRHFHTHS